MDAQLVRHYQSRRSLPLDPANLQIAFEISRASLSTPFRDRATSGLDGRHLGIRRRSMSDSFDLLFFELADLRNLQLTLGISRISLSVPKIGLFPV